MQNLGKTIDKIIDVAPGLKEKLVPIKTKVARFPHRSEVYWKQLVDVLNNEVPFNHPKRNRIKKILNPARRQKRHTYSFQEIQPGERLVGTLPENLADKVRRHDRKSIELAKMQVELRMTGNRALFAEFGRKNALLEIEHNKIWISIRDFFGIWDIPAVYTIRTKGPVLVLVTVPPEQPRSGATAIPMDSDVARKLFESLGIDPPPGLFPEEGENDE